MAKTFKYDIYLAGPFFNDAQKARMDAVKEICLRNGMRVADPRELGPVIVDTAAHVKTPEFFQKIFDGNIEGMRDSFMILASLDDKDIGTAFELGWFFAQSVRPVVSFAFEGGKTNVMLGQAVDGHFTSAEELDKFLSLNMTNIRDEAWVNIIHYLDVINRKAESDE